jgi:hypothetical protein
MQQQKCPGQKPHFQGDCINGQRCWAGTTAPVPQLSENSRVDLFRTNLFFEIA